MQPHPAGRNLAKDGLWGKADPYVQLQLGEQKARSETVGNSQDPIWGFTATLMLDERSPGHLLLEVYDADLGKDDLLGSASIQLRDIVLQRQLFDQWVPLQGCQSGEVLVAATFRPLGSQALLEAQPGPPPARTHQSSSSSSSSSSDSSSDEDGEDIQSKIIGCMDKVRLLQQAKEAFAGGLPEAEDRSQDIEDLKRRSALHWRSAVTSP
jgi:hypothetical protein